MSLLPEAEGHYLAGFEDSRLLSASGRLEFLRTVSVIRRFGPESPARVLDLGGGTGPYAFHLAHQGFDVDLIDAMPLHIQQASAHPVAPLLKRIATGDARALDYPDESFDAVLLMGPLYHLMDRADRLRALGEVRRVLRSDGVVFAAAISRFASLVDGFFRGLIADPDFEEIVRQDLKDGQHRNPNNHPDYFTTAKFHTAAELLEEMIEAGFAEPKVVGLEGFGSVLSNLDRLDERELARLMEFLELVEAEPEMMGVSSHLMGIGKKG
ncbi:MAG: methyltransferase domain-containing protein, partial [Fimbriimonadaceae bacterium]